MALCDWLLPLSITFHPGRHTFQHLIPLGPEQCSVIWVERSLFTHPPAGGYLGGSHFLVVLPPCTSLCVHAGWDAHRESGRGSLRQLYVSHFEEPPSCPLNRPHRFPRPPAAGEGPDFSTPLPALVVICPFYLRRPNGDGVVSCCGSGFLFPAKFSLNAFRVLVSYLCVSFAGSSELGGGREPREIRDSHGENLLAPSGRGRPWRSASKRDTLFAEW